jgi:hypothetical protein
MNMNTMTCSVNKSNAEKLSYSLNIAKDGTGAGREFEMSLAPSTVTNKDVKELADYSRFIHHQIKFTGIRKSVLRFLLPMPFLLLIALSMAVYDSIVLIRYTDVRYDVQLLDSAAKTVWSSTMIPQYFEMNRLQVEGVFTNVIFSQYGINNFNEHYSSLLGANLLGQLVNNSNKVVQGIEKSSYRNYYRIKGEIHKHIDIKFYDPKTKEYVAKNMSYYDASRYVQTYTDSIVVDSKYFTDRSISGIDESSRSKAQEEKLVRYNSLNAILKFDRQEVEVFVTVIKEITAYLQTTCTVAIITISGVSVILCICYLAFLLPLNRKMTKLAIVMFTFDSDLVERERERFKQLVTHYSKVLKCNMANTIQNLDISFKQSTTRSATKIFAKSLASAHLSYGSIGTRNVSNNTPGATLRGNTIGKSRISKERRDKSRYVKGFTFNLRHIILTMISILLIIVLYSFVRYLVLTSLVAESAYVCVVIGDTANIYVNMLSMNVALLELVAYDNQVPIEGMPAKEYVLQSIGRLEGYYDDLVAQSNIDRGVASTELNEELNLNICDISKDLSLTHEGIKNCDQGMAGIANKSMKRFLPQYFKLAQQLVFEWSHTNSQEQRISLLRQSQYASMFMFQTYNSLGLVDEIYYTIMMPTVTHLLEELDSIHPAINLINIVSAFFFALLIPIGIQTAYFAIDAAIRNFWSMIFIIPVQLIDTNMQLKQRLKDSHRKDNFGSF